MSETAEGCVAYDRDGFACTRLCKAEDDIYRLRNCLRELKLASAEKLGWHRTDKIVTDEVECDTDLVAAIEAAEKLLDDN